MNKVFYVSCYPNSYLEEIRDNSAKNLPLGAQTFNHLFAMGLKDNNCDVNVIVVYVISFNKKKYNKSFQITENGIKYTFLPKLNIPKIGTLFTLIYIKRYLYKEIKKCKNDDITLYYDILLPYKYTIMKIFKKKCANIVGIVTDLPSFFETNYTNVIKRIKKFFLTQKNKFVEKCITHYVLITENMNDKINKYHVPYIVIEGLTQINDNLKIEGKNDKKIILYSGDLSKLYGITNLIDAFKMIKIKNVELHLYGKCNYKEELREICKKYNNIKFFETIDTNELIKKQQQAFLLINPRPLNLEFNMYSFPSKTIEYMSSGTPVLTTKLGGIPKEYYDYLFFTKGDSINDIYESLDDLLKVDQSVLIEKGQKAKKFVDENKNYLLQTKKVIDFVNKESC